MVKNFIAKTYQFVVIFVCNYIFFFGMLMVISHEFGKSEKNWSYDYCFCFSVLKCLGSLLIYNYYCISTNSCSFPVLATLGCEIFIEEDGGQWNFWTFGSLTIGAGKIMNISLLCFVFVCWQAVSCLYDCNLTINFYFARVMISNV